MTGASAGPGAATAKPLAAEGAAVVVHGRDKDRAEAVTERIRRNGGTASMALGDLATDEGAADVAHAAPQERADTYNINVISGVRMIGTSCPACASAAGAG